MVKETILGHNMLIHKIPINHNKLHKTKRLIELAIKSFEPYQNFSNKKVFKNSLRKNLTISAENGMLKISTELESGLKMSTYVTSKMLGEFLGNYPPLVVEEITETKLILKESKCASS